LCKDEAGLALLKQLFFKKHNLPSHSLSIPKSVKYPSPLGPGIVQPPQKTTLIKPDLKLDLRFSPARLID
jgi:hypothetical protein